MRPSRQEATVPWGRDLRWLAFLIAIVVVVRGEFADAHVESAHAGFVLRAEALQVHEQQVHEQQGQTTSTFLAQDERDASSAAPSKADLEFFEKQIRPLLIDHCVACHGAEEQEGSLRLDSRAAMVQGGNSGAAIHPGDPEQSLLMDAVHYRSFEMPPDGPLSEAQIESLERWIRDGAAWPEQDQLALQRSDAGAARFSDAETRHWSFQPIQRISPPVVDDEQWCRSDIDRFILDRLESASLHPAADAGRRTLIRRVTFDLTGLPPTPQAIRDFLNDDRPDAYERLVRSLLESPRFGERWAQMWLDVVRYADSDGYKADFMRPNAWRYRDYVIRAFNEDKPYDRFVLEQLAGDELAPDDPEALIATGFLRHWIYEFNQRDAVSQWQLILDDITETTADTFLAMGFSCARCHDHKYDPILQRDYFRLQAFFNSIRPIELPAVGPDEIERYQIAQRRWETETQSIRARMNELEAGLLEAAKRDAVIKFPADIQAIYHKPVEQRSTYQHQLWQLVHLQVLDDQQKVDVEKKLKGEALEEWQRLKSELETFAAIRPQPLPQAMSVIDWSDTAAETRLPGDDGDGVILPGWMAVFGGEDAEIVTPNREGSTGRRLALARWIVSRDNPLTSRVIVNRIWQQYFGRGLVATPNDFGRLGDAPTHPELLDFLALQLIERGWSLKQLHYSIVTSATYRQASSVNDPSVALRVDPDNHLLWKMRRRRLDAGQLRDGLLAVSGELDFQMGGPASPPGGLRRTIYQRVKRNDPDGLLVSFDAPSRIASVGRRLETITPNQALTLMNGKWMQDRCAALAGRFAEATTLDGVLAHYGRMSEIVLGRMPTPDEHAYVRAFVHDVGLSQRGSGERSAATPAVWLDLACVLMNTNEFLYLD